MTALPQQLRLSPPAAEPDPLADLTDDQRRQIGQRLAIVQAWRNTRARFDRKGEALRVFRIAHPGVSKTTIYGWDAAYRADGLIGLLDRRSKVERAAVETVSDEAWRHFLSAYLTIHRRTVALCFQITAEQARERGWAWPSLRTIQLKVRRDLPPVHADFWRLGEKQWLRRYRPKLRRNYGDYRSGEWWVGDFKRLDVFCRKSADDPTIVRPLLSAFTDLRSRMVMGWHLTLREIQDAVLLGFRAGVERHGPPRSVIIDNGKPYRATGVSGGRSQLERLPDGRRRYKLKRIIDDEDYVRSVFGGLHVAVHFSIPFNPDSKPIERWFRTLDLQFAATFASYCGGDQGDRFRAAHKLATERPESCPTVAELGEALGRYVEAYHLTPHSGDGMGGLSPARAFERFDPVPRAVLPDGALDVLLMRVSKPVKVTEYGVRHNGVEYGQTDPRLFELIGQQVTLRTHPDDASYVLVCDLAGSPICRATNNRLARSGITQDDVGEGIRNQRRARKLVKQLYEGQTKAARQDVTEAAIAAQLAAGRRADEQSATGTDGKPVRNVTPLRSDFTDAVQRLRRQVSPPPVEPAMPTLADLDEILGGGLPRESSGLKLEDLEELL